MENQAPQAPIQTGQTPTPTPVTQPIKKFPATPVLIVVLILLVVAIIYLFYQNRVLKEELVKYTTPTPVPLETVDASGNWKIYTSETGSYQFSVPKEWMRIEENTDSPNRIIFQSTDGVYRITADMQVNINPATNEPYATLDEFIGLPYVVKAVTVDNLEARQKNPSAGAEDRNTVYFFSPDAKSIHSLELLVGDGSGNDHRVVLEALRIGADIFDRIVDSFKFAV